MNFSDWITIVSILLAVLLAVFKFDEWEVIRLKKIQNYLWLPVIFLFLSGMAAYFQSNSHPIWLSILWVENGWSSGLWAIIWITLFFTSSYFQWKKFTNKKPTLDLVFKYNDYLDTYEPAKFSSLFRKYEKYFFKPNDDASWLPYEIILTNEKWWTIAPTHFKEMVYEDPSRFYKMDVDVLKSLLSAQLKNIPGSQIGKELEYQWNGVSLSEETPLLNIFLSSPYYIETSRERNILLPSVKEIAEEYFSSINFLEYDKKLFLIRPSENAYRQVAPKSLIPFYYIQFIDCYWYQVFSTRARVSGFFFYLTWTEKILEVAPIVTDNDQVDNLPNLYLFAVDRMLSNINRWVYYLTSNNCSNFHWAANHFVQLKRRILHKIQDKYVNKVPQAWLVHEIRLSLRELIDCKNAFSNNFEPDLNNHNLDYELVKNAFDELTDDDFYLESEQQNTGYQWMKGIVGID